jgi:hypothetical protein
MMIAPIANMTAAAAAAIVTWEMVGGRRASEVGDHRTAIVLLG